MTDKKEEILNKDDITQLHGAQLLATKDGLLNEAKKHADISQLYADSQAKERAIGFAEWLMENEFCRMDAGYWSSYLDNYQKRYNTTSELFEIFTKQKQGMKKIKIISGIGTVIFAIVLFNEMIILTPDTLKSKLIVFNTLVAFLISFITFIIIESKHNNP